MARLIFLTAVLLLTPAAGMCQAGAQQGCPRVVLTCPTEMLEQGVPMTFTATVSGGDPNAQYAFDWTSTAGTITSGQGTRAMTLDTTGLAGLNIKVTVEVVGFPQSCVKSESCEAGVKPQPLTPHPIDRYSNLSFEDEKLRLDNFAIHLLQETSWRGIILVHAGEGVTPAGARKRARRALSHLTNTRGIPAARVVLIYSGRSAGETVLWALPGDVEVPFPGEIIKFGRGKVRGGRGR